MDYEQALEWVHSLPRLAAHPGVENTRRLLEKLGNPEKSLRFVHVAGTNGKGSATVMLASVLHRAGYRVGASVSPYVLEFRERFLLDGEMISRETLAQILTEVRAAAEGLRAEGWDSLVEFDAVTAATLLWFARERCDIVCLEVGLGGRLDSTNAVENKIAALEGGVEYGPFFENAPAPNENRKLITGVVCGVRVEDIEDPLMQKIRYLDKLIDELAKGRPMEKILRGTKDGGEQC